MKQEEGNNHIWAKKGPRARFGRQLVQAGINQWVFWGAWVPGRAPAIPVGDSSTGCCRRGAYWHGPC